jgi:predicted ATPase
VREAVERLRIHVIADTLLSSAGIIGRQHRWHHSVPCGRHDGKMAGTMSGAGLEAAFSERRMRIDAIAIHEFAPFRAQKCELGNPGDGQSKDVHIFVGENGTGKTRLLSLLLAACGNPNELNDRSTASVKALVVSAADGEGRRIVWVSNHNQPLVWRTQPAVLLDAYASRGDFQIAGINGARSSHMLQHAGATAAMAFRSVAAIRDEKLKPMAPVNWGQPNDILMFSRNDNAALCQALMNLKIRAGMHIASDPSQPMDRVIGMTQRLERTLQEVTGRSFAFYVEQEGAEARAKVKWGDVRMRLHQLPDGVRAILGWLAACVARLDLLLPEAENPLDQPAIIFLDEPETHLHPAWQRKVIPALKALLPKAQIFVATHSPFVVSSVNEGWIYGLKADKDGRVQIGNPKACSKGDTYIDVVEDVLGLKEWYDPETEGMLAKFRGLRDTALKTFAELDKAPMMELAEEIAKRSESLQVMMGNELAQFRKKEAAASR